MFKFFGGAVRYCILGLIEGAELLAERAVSITTIPRIHEGEYSLLHLEKAARIILPTLGFGRDDAIT